MHEPKNELKPKTTKTADPNGPTAETMQSVALPPTVQTAAISLSGQWENENVPQLVASSLKIATKIPANDVFQVATLQVIRLRTLL